jgi:hypothetical protein
MLVATACLINVASLKRLPDIRLQHISCFGRSSSSSRQDVPLSYRAVFSITTLNLLRSLVGSARAKSIAEWIFIPFKWIFMRRPTTHFSHLDFALHRVATGVSRFKMSPVWDCSRFAV